MAQHLILRYAARSDVGKIRAKNDDSAYAGHYLAVVADGMGGHAGGDVASACTVLDLIHLDHDGYAGDAGTHLADEIQTANSLLSELVHVNPKLAGMGTTVTALLLSEGKLEFAHIGDSRAYRLKNGVYEQISIDHTFVQRLIDEGRLSPAEAETHPHKNVLMRVLGDVDASPELDLRTFDAQVGERWLLCSDGLNFVRPDVVEDVVRSTVDLGECADRLVELTLQAGAPDNISVVVFDVAEAAPEDTRTARLTTVPSSAFPEGDDDGENGLGTHINDAVIRQELAERPHELVGAAVTAAAQGKIPTIAGRTAARRAAMVLTHRTAAAKAADEADAADETEGNEIPSNRRRWVLAIVGAVLLIGILIGAGLGYAWTQTRYYVGASKGHVAIYNGVSQSLGPISLSHVYLETNLEVASLPAFSQQQVQQTLPASSIDDARAIISNLQLGSQTTVGCPSPSASPTPSATAKPSTSAPPSTKAPATKPLPKATPSSKAAPTKAPATKAPVTKAPVTKAPVAKAPAATASPSATAAPSASAGALCPGGTP